jgi:hypothetical protein
MDTKKITLDVSQLNCLQSVRDNIFNYLDDKSSISEIDQTFQCIELSINKFITVTKPSVNNKYSYKELQHFLNRYLLDNHKINDAFMMEIMKIKAFVLGGDVEYLSKEEISKGRSYLTKLKSEMETLLGSMRVITFQESFRNGSEKEKIPALIKKAVVRMTMETAFVGDYRIEDSISFFLELARFAGHDKLYSQIKEYTPLAIHLKNLFIGLGNNTQGKSQWLQSVQWAVDVFNIALKINWLYHNFNLESEVTWIEVTQVGDTLLNLLKQSPQFVHHRIWHTHHLDLAIEEIMKLGLVRSILPKEVWIKSYKMAVLRFLARDLSSEKTPSQVTFIEESHVKLFESEWDVWKSNQYWLLNLKSFDRATLKESAKRQIQLGEGSIGHQQWLKIFAEDKFYTLSSYRNVTFGSSLFYNPNLNVSGLSLMNTIHTLSRFMLQSYGDGGSVPLWNKKLRAVGLAKWEADFFDLLAGLRVIDPRVLDRPKRFIQEANLFTLSGNGDYEIDLTELSELITLMFVSGKFMTDQFFSELILGESLQKCPISGYDLIGKPKFSKKCVADAFYAFFPKILNQIEGLRLEWASLNSEEKLSFIQKLLSLGKVRDSQKENLMEYVEYRSSIVFLYYLESIFTIYDKDGSWSLSYQEVLEAYPRFKNFIQERVYAKFHGKFRDSISTFIRDWDALTQEVFLYIVYNGKEPSLSDLMTFQFRKIKGLELINRSHLLNVFSYLKSIEKSH